MFRKRVNKKIFRLSRYASSSSLIESLEERRLLAADFEPNDTIEQAVNIGSGNQFHTDGAIVPGDPADWVRWTASGSGTVRFDAIFNHDQGDLVLSLHNSSGSELVRVDTITDNERAEIAVTSGQVVFAKVSPFFEGGSAPYQLRVTEILPDSSEPNNSSGGGRNLGSSNQTLNNLTIHSFGEKDFFRWTAPADGILNAQLQFSHADGDMDLWVTDTSGNALTSSQSSTDNEMISVGVSSGETVILEMFEFTGQAHPDYDLTINFVAPPTISDIGFTFGFADTPTLIPITLTDADDPLDSIVLSGFSDTPSVIPSSNIRFLGSGSDRIIELTPLQFGTSTITITANDLNGGLAEQQFIFAAFRNNTEEPPFVSDIPDQTINEDSSTGNISFVMSDDNTTVTSLNVTALSSDTDVIPTGNVTVNVGSPSSTVRVTPAADRVGSSVITLVVTDGAGNETRKSFTVTVNPVDDPGSNDPPTFDPIPNQTIPEDSGTHTVNITGVGPGGSGEGGQSVSLSASSSDPFLFPSVSVSGTQLRLTPGPNRTGSAIITVQATDSGGGVDTFRRTFVATVVDVNDPPTMSDIDDDSIGQGKTESSVDVFVSDLETPPSLLAVSATSSNQSVIANSAISITGSGSQRTVTATPAGQAGTTTITVFVSDGSLSTSRSYNVTVLQAANPPVVSGVSNRTINEGASTGPISFGVSDPDTPASNLVVTASSSNTTLVPNANLQLGGSGSTRTINVSPLPDQFGTATITLTASDGSSTGSTTFNVIVNPVNDAPSFTKGPNQTAFENSSSQSIPNWATNISAGPLNESSQTLSFNVTGNSNPTLFSVPPAISPNGTLTFTPAPNRTGSANITVVLTDNGGVANGGVNTSPAQSFSITVGSVNDPPSFTKGPNQTVIEDVGPRTIFGWASGISPGPGEFGQNVNFQITGNSNPSLFSIAPSITPAGTLTYTPAPNANGTANISVVLMDDGGTINGGVDTSAPQSFQITVTPVNDAPSFTPGPDQSISENSGPQSIANWATNLSAGPANESGQTLSFVVSGNSNPSLFAVPPAITGNGRLTYTAASGASGSATITVRLVDSGGTANGGVDSSSPASFNISIGSVNDPPSFTKGPDQQILEDAGPQSVAGWATNIIPGPPSEAGQNLTFEIASNSNPGLFSQQPAVSPTGQLTYTTAAKANGSAVVGLRLRDDGGTANGGNDVSPTQSFVISVGAVNDVPTFTAGPNVMVSETSTPQVFPGWATNISPGGPDEAGQSLTFSVVLNDNPGLFAFGPTVSATGTLTFTPATGASGTAMIGVRLADNGGQANGGVNESATQTFQIMIGSINDEPSFSKGPDQTVGEDSGPHSISGWATNINPGGPNEAGQQLTFNVTSNSNPGLFSSGPSISSDGTLTYTLAPDAFGFAAVTVVLMDDGGTGGGGDDTSDPQSFTFNVTPVNDAPSFVIGPDQNINEDAGPQSISNWATNISAGPGESDQTLQFQITSNSNPSLFSSLPTVALDGTLTYTVAPETSGSADIGLALRDNGGTVSGGADRSAVQTFSINVGGQNDLPTISSIDDQTVGVGLATPTLTFTVGDVETAPENLLITATSSNTTVIPNANIVLAGSGTDRTVRVISQDSTPGLATITIAVDDGEDVVTETFNVTVIDNDPPVVLSTQRDDGSGRLDQLQSISFTFDEDVSGSIDASDLVLIDSNRGVQPNLGTVNVNYDSGTNTATFDISQANLPLGRYIVTLRGSGISDMDGNLLDGNRDGTPGDDYLEIMVLTYAGDTDLDLDVDFSDFLVLSANFGKDGLDWQSGDFDRNGSAEFNDFLQLSANFGRSGQSQQFQRSGGSTLKSFFGSSQARAQAAAAAAAFESVEEEGEWWRTI